MEEGGVRLCVGVLCFALFSMNTTQLLTHALKGSREQPPKPATKRGALDKKKRENTLIPRSITVNKGNMCTNKEKKGGRIFSLFSLVHAHCEILSPFLPSTS
jgi:hypothetical protein